MTGRYIAFDVETPNAANDRISAIGVTVVEDGRIVDSYASLVDPETRFDRFNIALTGIAPEDVRGAPNFPALWERIEPLMRSGLLTAHNAPFDMGVLGKCLRDYGIAWQPYVDYLCTCQLGRRLLPELPNHKLNTLCSHFGIALDHHRADSDSRACAELLRHYLQCAVPLSTFVRRFDLAGLRTLRCI